MYVCFSSKNGRMKSGHTDPWCERGLTICTFIADSTFGNRCVWIVEQHFIQACLPVLIYSNRVLYWNYTFRTCSIKCLPILRSCVKTRVCECQPPFLQSSIHFFSDIVRDFKGFSITTYMWGQILWTVISVSCQLTHLPQDLITWISSFDFLVLPVPTLPTLESHFPCRIL